MMCENIMVALWTKKNSKKKMENLKKKDRHTVGVRDKYASQCH